jgi:thymidylate synthase
MKPIHFEKDNFNALYFEIVKHVIEHGHDITVGGKKTKECINCSLSLTNIKNDKIDFSKTKPDRQEKYEKYYESEKNWYQSGCLVAEHSPAPEFWKTIADTDGKIQSNYGHMILYDRNYTACGDMTEYENAIRLLKSDKFSRQVILHYNLPKHYKINSKDIPCTICTQILIRNDKVSFLVFQRSSDLYKGLIYDLPWHCYLMKKLVHDLKHIGLNFSAGTLTMFLGSVHIYEGKEEKFLTKFIKENHKDAYKK